MADNKVTVFQLFEREASEEEARVLLEDQDKVSNEVDIPDGPLSLDEFAEWLNGETNLIAIMEEAAQLTTELANLTKQRISVVRRIVELTDAINEQITEEAE